MHNQCTKSNARTITLLHIESTQIFAYSLKQAPSLYSPNQKVLHKLEVLALLLDMWGETWWGDLTRGLLHSHKYNLEALWPHYLSNYKKNYMYNTSESDIVSHKYLFVNTLTQKGHIYCGPCVGWFSWHAYLVLPLPQGFGKIAREGEGS